MSIAKRKRAPVVKAARARSGHSRQRQRLIDACISALHIHGPSRTTVEKVVAIAKMSPGIVRFYFDSKAAMLVASLQFLSTEFEERVLVPVAKLKARPVAALELMVDLYLDPDIASARKVSVWYAFWGEASSRQEYYDICGQKDESFAALIRELIGSLIDATARRQLDPDAIALGLIGVFEILWQDFAFQTEGAIDRAAAKRRCMAFLRSIFPEQFAESPADPRALPNWVYRDARVFALEREWFKSSWQWAGHLAQLPRAGDFFTVETAAERILVVRDQNRVVRALRNNCPMYPHRLVALSHGQLGSIRCDIHGLNFALDGRAVLAAACAGAGAGVTARASAGVGVGIRPGLQALDLCEAGGLLFVRSLEAREACEAREAREAPGPREPRDPPNAPETPHALLPGFPLDLRPLARTPPSWTGEVLVRADWKILVEQWLLAATPEGAAAANEALTGNEALAAHEALTWTRGAECARGWSLQRYATILGTTFGSISGGTISDGARNGDIGPTAARAGWQRCFLAPNHLVEVRPDGASVLQVIPVAPGECRLRRIELTRCTSDRVAGALAYLANRAHSPARAAAAEMAHSAQRGLVEFGYPAPEARLAPAVLAFRRSLLARVLARLPAIGADPLQP